MHRLADLLIRDLSIAVFLSDRSGQTEGVTESGGEFKVTEYNRHILNLDLDLDLNLAFLFL
jgi:hypothetical protein